MLNPFTHEKVLERGVQGRARVVSIDALDRDADLIGSLERLAALHAAGALRDDESAAQKRRLLGDG